MNFYFQNGTIESRCEHLNSQCRPLSVTSMAVFVGIQLAAVFGCEIGEIILCRDASSLHTRKKGESGESGRV